MPFCTSCGANVTGAFCTNCGTPLPASGAQAAAPPQPPPPPQPQFSAPPPPPPPPQAQFSAPPPPPQYAQPQYQPMPPAAPPRKGMSPVMIVLIVLGCLFLLAVVGVVGTVMYVGHKVKQFGNNPGMGVAKMIVGANPDAEVVSEDDSTGTLTVKDRKTGKIVTMNFNDIQHGGKFSFTADDDNGGKATMQIGGDAKPNLPSWLPTYPGSDPKATFSLTGNTSDGSGGNYTFTTSDGAPKVMEWYQDKVKSSGLEVKSTTTAPTGSMMTASDDGEKRTMVVLVGESGGQTTVNVTYGEKK